MKNKENIDNKKDEQTNKKNKKQTSQCLWPYWVEAPKKAQGKHKNKYGGVV